MIRDVLLTSLLALVLVVPIQALDSNLDHPANAGLKQILAKHGRVSGLSGDVSSTPTEIPLNPLHKEERAEASASDEALASKIGVDPKTGEVNNPTKAARRLELDTWAGYLIEARTIKVGPSLVLWRPDQNSDWKLALDAGDEFVGVSFNKDFIPVIRAAAGLGYGRLFSTGTNQLYGSISFKIW